jgi:transposase
MSSEANEISEKDAKKTISAEHVAMALKELGFESYVGPVLESAEDFRKTMAVSLCAVVVGVAGLFWTVVEG